MNKNQIKTLALYALNYSYKEISQTLNVSVNTIKWRLKTVRIRYPEYWDNARSVRDSYKKCKIGLCYIKSLEDAPIRNKVLCSPGVLDSISIEHLLMLIDID
jgi:hypothetical protein